MKIKLGQYRKGVAALVGVVLVMFFPDAATALMASEDSEMTQILKVISGALAVFGVVYFPNDPMETSK